MERLTEPTLFVFLLQGLLLSLYIPLSYIGYKWVRVPLKENRTGEALLKLGMSPQKISNYLVADKFELQHYFWPLFFAFALTFGTFSVTHPYIIKQGMTAGILEEVINVFGSENPFPPAVVAGRFLFWGWMGAYIYSVHLTFRRFMALDLTPNVYIYTSNRFWLALTIGAIVGIGVGTIGSATGLPFDLNVASASIVTFSIGFFPEQGINWISVTTKEILKQQGGITTELLLSEIEGLSIWQQGRLEQENIENIQNLVTAEIPILIGSTPFSINQIVDWIDQGILLVYASETQSRALKAVGLSRASSVLVAMEDRSDFNKLAEATGLEKNGLKMLHITLLSASNIKLVTHFWWQASLDNKKVDAAKLLKNTLKDIENSLSINNLNKLSTNHQDAGLIQDNTKQDSFQGAPKKGFIM